MTSPSHVPVLLDRVVALLAPALDHEGAVMVDATLGLGGHTEAVLRDCSLARVVGIDRDEAALALAAERLAPYGDRFTGVHAVYDEIPEVLDDLGLDAVDGVLFDLGVSSMQLDVTQRGFAYREDAPLDMRMDTTGGHPAKRTFQALRMEVNDELAVLRRALPAAIDAIRVGGRVVVESYHSLEDRLVKQAFTAATRSDVPPEMPFVPEGHEPALRLVTRGAEKADQQEIEDNPRAASVRLRAIERIKGVAS